MTVQKQLIFWALAFAAFFVFIYLFNAVLMPFVLGAAVAYLLNPLVNKLGGLGMARGAAAFMILGGFFLTVLICVAAMAPLVYKQSAELVNDLPGYWEQFVGWVEPYSQSVFARLGLDENAINVKELAGTHGGSIFNGAQGVAGSVLGSIAAGGMAVLDFVSLMVFMPIVAYFLIKEWIGITNWAEGLLPRDHEGTIKDLIKQIDMKISGFVRGQISVAVILGVGYAIALSIAGLKYGFLIGLLSGLLSVVPMIGSIVGLVMSVLVAWFQAGELSYVAIIAAIFLVGQILEGNVITPKLVGESVGLHPLWVFFALLAGGSLFGILGMFLAVPVAAVAGVLLGFAIARYKMSSLFKGTHKNSNSENSEDASAQDNVKNIEVPVEAEQAVEISDQQAVDEDDTEKD